MTPSSPGCPVRRCSTPGAPSLGPCIQNTPLASRCLRRSVQIEPWTRGGGTPCGRVSGIRAVRNASDRCGAPNFPSLGDGNFLETFTQGNFDRGEATGFGGLASKNRIQDLRNPNKLEHEYSQSRDLCKTGCCRLPPKIRPRLRIQVMGSRFPNYLDIMSYLGTRVVL